MEKYDFILFLKQILL